MLFVLGRPTETSMATLSEYGKSEPTPVQRPVSIVRGIDVVDQFAKESLVRGANNDYAAVIRSDGRLKSGSRQVSFEEFLVCRLPLLFANSKALGLLGPTLRRNDRGNSDAPL